MHLKKPIFQAGHIVTQRIRSLQEVDSHAWNLDRIQLSRGAFYYDLDAFHTSNVQLGVITHRSIRIAVQGDAPPDTIAFVMIINDGSIVQQKQTMTKNHLAIMEHGAEIDAVFLEPISFVSVAINRELFCAKYEEKYHEVYPVTGKFELRLCNTEMLRGTTEMLQSILKVHNDNQAFYALAENMQVIEDLIVHQMLNLLHTSVNHHHESKWVDTAHSLFELIKLRYEQDISIEMLCHELHVSQRNAYLTFQKHYGMTPKQYLLSIRLGKIKQALEVSDPVMVKIEHIALQNGFYHMSHFAKIYKSFFGELPSQTLWKHKS